MQKECKKVGVTSVCEILRSPGGDYEEHYFLESDAV